MKQLAAIYSEQNFSKDSYLKISEIGNCLQASIIRLELSSNSFMEKAAGFDGVIFVNPYSKDSLYAADLIQSSSLLPFIMIFEHALEVTFSLLGDDFFPRVEVLRKASALVSGHKSDMPFLQQCSSRVYHIEDIGKICMDSYDSSSSGCLEIVSDLIETNNICKEYLFYERARLERRQAEAEDVIKEYECSLSYKIGKLLCK